MWSENTIFGLLHPPIEAGEDDYGVVHTVVTDRCERDTPLITPCVQEGCLVRMCGVENHVRGPHDGHGEAAGLL